MCCLVNQDGFCGFFLFFFLAYLKKKEKKKKQCCGALQLGYGPSVALEVQLAAVKKD